MDLTVYHTSVTWNLEVALGFLENLSPLCKAKIVLPVAEDYFLLSVDPALCICFVTTCQWHFVIEKF